MRYCISALAILVAICANGQSVRGHIRDSQDKPLEFATISLFRGQDSVAVQLLITDSSGGFVSPAVEPGKYRMTVSFINHTPKEMNLFLTKDTVMDITLFPAQDPLHAATVTARKPLIEIKANKITINVQESPIAAGDNVYNVLLRAPGMTEMNGSLSFRTKSVLVLIDDRPVKLTDDQLKEMLSAMPANTIEKIEILPNPSAKYDAEGGSVVNIRMTKNSRQGWTGSLTSGGGTGKYPKFNEGMTLNYRKGGWNFYSSYDFQHSRQYYANHSNRLVDSSSNILQQEYQEVKRNIHSYAAGVDVDMSKSSTIGVQFRGMSFSRRREVANNSQLTHLADGDSSSVVYTRGKAMVVNPSLNIYYKTKLDSTGKELTINGDYFRYDKQWRDSLATDYLDKDGNSYLPPYLLLNNSPALITNYSASADYVHPAKIGKFEAGLKMEYTRSDDNALWQQQVGGKWLTDSTKTNHFIYKEYVNAGYISFSKTFTHYNVVIGARVEKTHTEGDLLTTGTVNKSDYLDVFPNVSLEYVKNLNHIIDLSYRESIERFGFNLVNPFVIYQSQYSASEGNPHIQPEIDRDLELSYTLKQALVFGASYTHGVRALAPIYVQGSNEQVISTYDNLKSDDLFYVYADLHYLVTKWWTTYVSAGTGFLRYNTTTASVIGPSNSSHWSYLLQTENTFHLGHGLDGELNGWWRGPYASGIYMAKQDHSTSMGISKTLSNGQSSFKFSIQDIFNTDRQLFDINYQGIRMTVDNKPETRFFYLTYMYKFGNRNVKSKKEHASDIDDIRQRAGSN